MDKLKLHRRISDVKSYTRILGYSILVVNVRAAAFVLVVAELLGKGLPSPIGEP